MIPIKEYVEIKKEEIKNQILLNQKLIPITLGIIQVGDNSASNAYIKGKIKDCEEVGIKCNHIHLSEDVPESSLLEIVSQFNSDPTITGFIVQLPLPKHIDEKKVIELINPNKDVDGFSVLNNKCDPATPQGIIDYLEYNHFDFTDKNAVVIGRSNIVGKPIAKMLLERDCNVTQIHSKTSENNKRTALAFADLVIVATGHRDTLMDKDVLVTSPKCFIVDVGMNKNDNGKLCGDCEHVTLRDKTPVPGGVGLLTRLALLTNLMKLEKEN